MSRPSSGDQVADHVRRLIWDGTLRNGDHLRQDDIANDLGVSRIPVREALIALERQGWVSLEPHRGAFIRGLDEVAVGDHYAFLGALYALTARRVTERAEDSAIEALDEARLLAAAAPSADEFLSRNEVFLRRFYAAANSSRLSSISRMTSGVVPGNYFATVPAGRAIQEDALADAMEALRARDGDRAASVFEHAFARHGQAVIDVLRGHRAAAGNELA
ncbi:GntR family transcriptional regulator [Yinghuangia sp. ASG 101]|uniref:GntR family transcriptional regulator n=1 Tax=Yinghuangia sp. ASG 101 TaxID=2896848 RepID=UPI001E627C13|nr:GntR family transcriptional regulator [Yinghuangia sp. ASG 101]UGQ13390.1 GntR family transcriptional regulator [Yinghuangia sp. ASG 101]